MPPGISLANSSVRNGYMLIATHAGRHSFAVMKRKATQGRPSRSKPQAVKTYSFKGCKERLAQWIRRWMGQNISPNDNTAIIRTLAPIT